MAKPEEARPQRLRDALRQARVEAAERTGIVVDLHDAEVARLELLSDAIEPLFEEIPTGVDLFDLALSRGETPRLWIDAIAHVVMGRDKRVYRFVQDTRYGRKVLTESAQIPDIVQSVTRYIAQRLIERERALANGVGPAVAPAAVDPRRERAERRRRRRGAIRAFLLGLVIGVVILVAAALFIGP
jgi:hypothetical protein